jgi:hypothetical protein
MLVNNTWIFNSLFIGIVGLVSFICGAHLAHLWFKDEILRLKALKKADTWETPKDFKMRTGSSLPGEAAVYCRWKKDGPMYERIKTLRENNMATNPDEWIIHTYFTALSIGNAHGEQMEIFCANSDMGCPPPTYKILGES